METRSTPARAPMGMIPTWLGLVIIAAVLWVLWRVMTAGGEDAAVAPAATAQTPAASTRDQDALWLLKAQEDVRASLRDGESAQFRGVFIHRREGAPFVCGEVNAKNGFGGRNGFQRFIYAGSLGIVLEEQMAAGEIMKAWREFCGG